MAKRKRRSRSRTSVKRWVRRHLRHARKRAVRYVRKRTRHAWRRIWTVTVHGTGGTVKKTTRRQPAPAARPAPAPAAGRTQYHRVGAAKDDRWQANGLCRHGLCRPLHGPCIGCVNDEKAELDRLRKKAAASPHYSQTNSRPRPAGGNPTMSSTPNSRRTATAETESIRKGGLGVAEWEPGSATETHAQLAGLGVAVASVAAGILQYAETVAGMGADPRRIVNPLVELATALTSNSGDLTKIARTFRTIYGSQMEQEDAGVRPMTYPKAAA